GWEDWSWNTNVAREHPYALSGRALAFQYREGYAGFSLRTPVALSRSEYEAIAFWISGGEDPDVRQIMFLVQSADEGGESRRFHLDVPARTWTQVIIPFALLRNVTAIKRINFQDRTGQAQAPVFLDNICFLRDTGGVDLSGMVFIEPGDYLIFDESTADDVENWSWDTALSFANAQPAIGLRSLAVQHQKGYAGLSLRLKSGVSAADFGGIVFRIHGGEQGRRQLDFFIQQADEGGESQRVSFDVPAGKWYEVAIPVSALGDVKTIKRINLQDASGKPQSYYVDNLVLVRRAVSLAVPAPRASTPAPTQPAIVAPTLPQGFVYRDALAPGWENWSWDTQVNFANAQPALGRRSIAVRYTKGYAGLSLRAPITLEARNYSAVVLWLHGGDAGERQLRFFVQQTDTGGESRMIPLEAPAGVWTPITIPLSFLGDLRTIKRLNLQDTSGVTQPVFYVDNVQLVREALTTTLPTPSTGPTPEGGFVVYRDGYLADGWENWSWDTQANLRNREPVLFGARSLAVKSKAAGGLSLRAPITLEASHYGGILFRILGGDTRPRRLQLFVQTADDGGETPSFVFDATPRRWLTFTVPFSALGNPAVIKRISIQDLSGASETTYYVDEITLLPPREKPQPPRVPYYALFGNILAKGWREASRGAQVSLREANVVRAMYGIAVQALQPGTVFKLETSQPMDMHEFAVLSFWVNGGTQGVRALKAQLYAQSGAPPVELTFDAPANTWREVRIPLAGVSSLQAFAIQAPAGSRFYLDDIRLVRALQP
ncbi:MAG: hypothetical protein N2545_05670, partial [Thermoflexales bacterium]|nr:hypothetical protein [Thermoflexales bacterium]